MQMNHLYHIHRQLLVLVEVRSMRIVASSWVECHSTERALEKKAMLILVLVVDILIPWAVRFLLYRLITKLMTRSSRGEVGFEIEINIERKRE